MHLFPTPFPSSHRYSTFTDLTPPPRLVPPPQDEMFVMSDLDLAGPGSRGSLPRGDAAGPPAVGDLRDPPPVRPASAASSEEVPLQRRPSLSSEGSEERAGPKFLPGDYNFLITTVPEEDESETVSDVTRVSGSGSGSWSVSES